VAKGNPRRPRGVAASDFLPLFPPDVSDKPVSRRNERAAAPNVVAMPRRTGPTPEDLARKAMAHQPTGASGKKVKRKYSPFPVWWLTRLADCVIIILTENGEEIWQRLARPPVGQHAGATAKRISL
jgi:hypothetical protein